jgi:molecular chaperone DnaK (HSP70)
MLLNDPIAAAIAYGYNRTEGEKNIIVYDLGGASLDVSLF